MNWTNKRILSKITFGSKTPFKNEDGYYYILYKTTCLPTKKIYIGIFSTKEDYIKSRYIGNGVDSNNRKQGKENGISHFRRAVKLYGYSNFVRENLLFFSSREDSLRAEKIIVDQDFINNKQTLNCCLGGGAPPRKIGKENGNYNKRWTKEKRKEMSDYFKNNRNTKGGNNIRARKNFLVNILTDEIIEFSCLKETCLFIGLESTTIGTLVKEMGEYHVFRGRFLCLFFKPTKEQLVEIYHKILQSKFKRKKLLLTKMKNEKSFRD